MRSNLLLSCLFAVGFAMATSASAAPDAKSSTTTPPPATQPRLNVPVKAALVMDAITGEVLYQKNAHNRNDPASMVKMMVVLLALEDVTKGKAKLDAKVTVTANAARIGGHQIYLKQGEVFTLQDLLKAVLIGSANDAAYAVAEYLGGTQEAYVERMNQRAKELGMVNTRFFNAHGLPPDKRKGQQPNYTSAYDMTVVARALIKHPLAMKWASTRDDTLRDGTFQLRNTNHHFLRKFKGGDGLKTGYHAQGAGFCVTATAQRDGRRLLAVVMGAESVQNRVAAVSDLLEWGFTGKTVTRTAAVSKPKTTAKPQKSQATSTQKQTTTTAKQTTTSTTPSKTTTQK